MNQDIRRAGKRAYRQSRGRANHTEAIVLDHRRSSFLPPMLLPGLAEFLLHSGQHNVRRNRFIHHAIYGEPISVTAVGCLYDYSVADFSQSVSYWIELFIKFSFTREHWTCALGLLTHILTQNGKGAGGNGGRNRARKHSTPEQTRPESAKKPPPAPLAAAHNPKVVGSNPAPATIDSPISLEIGGSSLLFLTFLRGQNFDFPQVPGFDPYSESSSQAPYRSFPVQTENSLIPLFVLSPTASERIFVMVSAACRCA
ncbi:MAG: hypothetical protein HFF20_05785 [Oscillospiraceae bacterium]|nr:hypothetical protein [Oscillospiraceae bacterium]